MKESDEGKTKVGKTRVRLPTSPPSCTEILIGRSVSRGMLDWSDTDKLYHYGYTCYGDDLASIGYKYLSWMIGWETSVIEQKAINDVENAFIDEEFALAA